MALINADDARAAARNVVQNGLGHFEPNAKLLQPGGNGAAKIMKRPGGHAASPIEASLRLAPARKDALLAWKDKVGFA